MSETVFTLRRKIKRVHELKSVVRTMKAMAAASLSQYERSVQSLETYARTVDLGLVVCLRHSRLVAPERRKQKRAPTIGVLVFGSDQGMVGQFNEHLAGLVARTLSSQAGRPAVWAVGERIQARLEDAGLAVERLYPRRVPSPVSRRSWRSSLWTSTGAVKPARSTNCSSFTTGPNREPVTSPPGSASYRSMSNGFAD